MKGVKSLSFVDRAQERDLAPVFGDLSQSEKNSKIKPPLKKLMFYYIQMIQQSVLVWT